MKHIVLLILLLHLKEKTSGQNKKDNIITFTSHGVSLNRKTLYEQKIKLYADSLNNYLNGPLPYFLSDECFEVTSHISITLDATTSVREEILKRVYNKKILQEIIKDKKNTYDKICTIEMSNDYPDYKASLRQLARRRIKQIKRRSL